MKRNIRLLATGGKSCVVLSCISLEIQQVKEQEQEGITDGKKNVSREERNSCLYCAHLQKDKKQLGSLNGSRDT